MGDSQACYTPFKCQNFWIPWLHVLFVLQLRKQGAGFAVLERGSKGGQLRYELSVFASKALDDSSLVHICLLLLLPRFICRT